MGVFSKYQTKEMKDIFFVPCYTYRNHYSHFIPSHFRKGRVGFMYLVGDKLNSQEYKNVFEGLTYLFEVLS